MLFHRKKNSLREAPKTDLWSPPDFVFCHKVAFGLQEV